MRGPRLVHPGGRARVLTARARSSSCSRRSSTSSSCGTSPRWRSCSSTPAAATVQPVEPRVLIEGEVARIVLPGDPATKLRTMQGRIAFVTGGASGIGKALSGALVARGASVVVADINASSAAAVAHELDGRGPGSATSVSLDVADAKGFERALGEVHEQHGRLDLLFNNAGIGIGGPVEELELAHWERTLDVNLRGVVHGVRRRLPVDGQTALRAHRQHRLARGSACRFPFGVPYAMTKHAVVGLSVSLRSEARAHGVRVSAGCPGVIDTADSRLRRPVRPAANQARRPRPRDVPTREPRTGLPARALGRGRAPRRRPESGDHRRTGPRAGDMARQPDLPAAGRPHR